MMTIRVKTTGYYKCYCSEEDAEMVQRYADAHNLSLEDAVGELYRDNLLNIWEDWEVQDGSFGIEEEIQEVEIVDEE